MHGAQTFSGKAVVESYLGWWSDAGLIDASGDRPCDWLTAPAAVPKLVGAEAAPVRRPARSPEMRTTDAATSIAPSLPQTLEAFDQWLATTPDLPGAEWTAKRCLPSGPVNPQIMIVTDVPDAADLDGGQLFSGPSGQMLDAMLGAIGRRRSDVRLASIALTRPVGGRIVGPERDALVAIARHHIALVRPSAMLVLGQQAEQLLGAALQATVNHSGVTMASLAIPHPRLLLERPLLKRLAWDVLKTMKERG